MIVFGSRKSSWAAWWIEYHCRMAKCWVGDVIPLTLPCALTGPGVDDLAGCVVGKVGRSVIAL